MLTIEHEICMSKVTLDCKASVRSRTQSPEHLGAYGTRPELQREVEPPAHLIKVEFMALDLLLTQHRCLY